jgi:hypothetical protein
LAAIAHEIEDGLNQVLFVTKGRFTKEEAEAYDLLCSVIFDSEVAKYTTIVKTEFPDFEDEQACERDRQRLRSENARLANIVNRVKKVLYVDNPPIRGRYATMAEDSQKESRKRLLTYLGTCQSIYKPSNLDTLNERVRDYMTDEEKLLKKMNELEKERAEQAEKFKKELTEIEAKRVKELAENRRIFEQQMRDLQVQSEQRLQATKNELQADHQRQMSSFQQQQEQLRREAESRHNEALREAKNANEQQMRLMQEQFRQGQQEIERLQREASKKSDSSAEIATLMQQMRIDDQNREDRRASQNREFEQKRLALEEQRRKDDAEANRKAQEVANERKKADEQREAGRKAEINKLNEQLKKKDEAIEQLGEKVTQIQESQSGGCKII